MAVTSTSVGSGLYTSGPGPMQAARPDPPRTAPSRLIPGELTQYIEPEFINSAIENALVTSPDQVTSTALETSAGGDRIFLPTSVADSRTQWLTPAFVTSTATIFPPTSVLAQAVIAPELVHTHGAAVTHPGLVTSTTRVTQAAVADPVFAPTLTQTDPAKTGAASGVWTFAGSASGSRTPKALGAGTFAFTGAAAGKETPAGAATGTWSTVGAAAGTAPAVGGAAGTATGSWSYTGAAGAWPTLDETFESYPLTVWAEGSSHGPWTVKFSGGGQVIPVDVAGRRVLQLESAQGILNPANEGTQASLVTSTTTTTGDLLLRARIRTVAQFRSGYDPPNTPKAWEVAWLGWNYTEPGTDLRRFYYVALKTIGFELGKVDQSIALTGGQRFLQTDLTPFTVGTWYDVLVQQVGAHIQVWVDGVLRADFTDGPSSGGTPAWGTTGETVMTSGAVALYHEDARVQFDDVSTSGTAETTVPDSLRIPIQIIQI